MQALKAMLDRVVQPRESSKWDYMDPNLNIYLRPSSEMLFWGSYLYIMSIE